MKKLQLPKLTGGGGRGGGGGGGAKERRIDLYC